MFRNSECENYTQKNVVLWYFYHLSFLLLTFLLSGIFTSGIFTFWDFYQWYFYLWQSYPWHGIFTNGIFTAHHMGLYRQPPLIVLGTSAQLYAKFASSGTILSKFQKLICFRPSDV